MSLNPLAPVFLPHYQPSSDPLISQCSSATMSLPLAQLFCGMPPQIMLFDAPSINQLNITGGTFMLAFTQPKKKHLTGHSSSSTTPRIFISFVFTSRTSGELSTSYSKDYPTVQPSLEARTPRPRDMTIRCPLTAKRFCLTALLGFLPGLNNLQQRYCR